MRSNKIRILPAAFFVLCGLASGYAQSSPRRTVVASGGEVSSQSPTHRVSGTIGQVASTRSQSPTHEVAAGFWNELGLCFCPYVGDINTDGEINVLDVVGVIDVAFRNGPLPPGDAFCPSSTRADLNCDAAVDVLDVIAIINATFRNDDQRCNPCAN